MLPPGLSLIIFFRKDQVFLCARSLSLRETNIPAIVSRFDAPVYWKVTVKKHLADEKELVVSIDSYNQGVPEISHTQQQLFPALAEIKRINFLSINTEKLLASAGSEGTSQTIIHDDQESAVEITKVVQESLSIPIKKLNFQLGRVTFSHRFKGFLSATEITIENYELREEFDAIKNYFAKVFGKKKIQVDVTLEIDGAYARISAVSSPEIASIDKKLIESVRFEFVRTLKKKIEPTIDKSLFTADELLSHFGEEEFKSNTFHTNAQELFEDLLQVSDSKHYLHLRYLSSIHASHILKLRFVHNPFSFIFLVEGDMHYHVIWETLDTQEATYLWHVDRDIESLKRALRKIEQIIHTVKVQGKTAYLNSNEPDRFRRVYHDYSLVKEGFLKWKGEVERYLT